MLNVRNVVFVKVDKLSDISDKEYSKYKVICIDEANFYDDLPEVVVNLLDKYDMEIHVAGLNGSFQRKPFGRVHELLPHIEPEEFVTCTLCSAKGIRAKAVYTKRLTDETEETVVGYDNYASVCRKCYLS